MNDLGIAEVGDLCAYSGYPATTTGHYLLLDLVYDEDYGDDCPVVDHTTPGPHPMRHRRKTEEPDWIDNEDDLVIERPDP